MAIAVRFEATCDACAHDGTNTPEAETYEFPAQLGAPAFVVELCADHYEMVRANHEALAALGRAPGKGAQTPRRGGPAPIAPAGTAICPGCGHVAASPAALRGHVRSVHDTTLAGIGFYPANEKCEVCGDGFPNKQGLRAHERAAHKQTA